MKDPSRLIVAKAAVLLALVGCNKTEVVGADARTDAAASASVAATLPSGRCKVSTPDAAYDAFFFYPERKEILTRMGSELAIEPLTITTSTAGRVDFTTRPRRDPDEQGAPRTQTGALSFAGAKWSFDFERRKDADCTVEDFDLTYRTLPEIGIKAGTWSSEAGLSMTFLADGQRFLQKYNEKTRVFFYRVLDKTDAGIVIGTSSTPPSSASGDLWSTSTLTSVGDQLYVTMRGAPLLLSYAGPPPETTDAGTTPVQPSPLSSGTPSPMLPVKRMTAPPAIRQGPMHVTPGLSAEVIQRLTRYFFGRFRLCYEDGLRYNPMISGRVTVSFVIGPSGSVSMAEDAGSDLPDRGIVSCVVRVFERMSFPAPDSAPVTVISSLLFEPVG